MIRSICARQSYLNYVTRKFVAKFKFHSFRFFRGRRISRNGHASRIRKIFGVYWHDWGGGGGEEEERGGGEGRTLITSVKMVGRRDVYEAVASNYALTGAVKSSRLPRSCVILVFVTSSGNRETPQVAAFVFSFFFSRDQFFFFYEKLILFKLIRIELIGLKIFLKKLIGKLRFFVTLEYIRRNLSIFRIRKIQFIVKSIYRNFLTIIRKGDDEMKLWLFVKDAKDSWQISKVRL